MRPPGQTTKLTIARGIMLAILLGGTFWFALGLLVSCAAGADLPGSTTIAVPPASDPVVTMITTICAVIAGLVAVWQNHQKATADKIRDTLILGIEHGTVLAERSGNPEAIKYAIRARALASGLEEILAPRVQQLTETVDDEESLERRIIEARLRMDASAGPEAKS